eukprot:UN34137
MYNFETLDSVNIMIQRKCFESIIFCVPILPQKLLNYFICGQLYVQICHMSFIIKRNPWITCAIFIDTCRIYGFRVFSYFCLVLCYPFF